MIIFIAIYFICFLFIWWGYCGSIMVYFLTARLKKQKTVTVNDDFPIVTLVIPCFNEASWIQAKIENTRLLNYPHDRLLVIFADGGSTDATVQLITDGIKELPWMRLLISPRKGKIQQLNHALLCSKGEIIMNSDVDGILEKDAIMNIAQEFMYDKEVGVVGAFVFPENTIPIERQFWMMQNKSRLLETEVFSSSIVIAVCYAFRRSIIREFPDDVIADDIFLPFFANMNGYKTIYSQKAVAYEARCPENIWELLQHKFRKCNAYIIELLRFLHKSAYMPLRWKMIYYTKLLQLLFLPWFLVLFFLMTTSFIILKNYEPLYYLYGIGGISLIIASFMMRSVRVPHGIPKPGGFIVAGVTFFISNAIQIAGAVTFPFYRQSSSYEKLKGKEGKMDSLENSTEDKGVQAAIHSPNGVTCL
ncbi:MAG: glycosyltransferase [Candidatus Jettenia sp.]|uniref:Putative glycosyltransferase n=1 Tax=Candidatus Jettenia caeni TaxID=247490 RepID=I3IR63_9BACT|nr:glycosyltransferase [Candidatus Jettenia sp. AMX1]MBC6928563.1 glycosyltransferase [Candidatus Jettenia sp.]WKZ15616.1 MAG: glycosyltransferase [Candidatus Jettenia caeni]KAA0249184.1 MAG: glycosyltransferase [Candidatus Jettenia sp. AMX1]MCE7879782.1 glycosyltransferase [Candidatus Jettenia sp. AMX1]MCQ3926463.1 glycosyltransferase [Candidatus Jettenia sp.]